MKLIIAFVRPIVIDRLIVALEEIENLPGMTVSTTEGFGQRIKTLQDDIRPLKPNRRVEIAAPNEMTDRIVATVREHAHTGKKGDGLILVLPVEESVII